MHHYCRARPPAMDMNPILRSMKQMTDTRVAKVSHILLKAGTPMPVEEAYAKFELWKAEIAGDEETFAAVARRESECEESASRGGDLGYVTVSRQLPPLLDDVVFSQQKKGEERPGVYGPIGSAEGLHLIYLHYCGEPDGEVTYPEWMRKMGKTVGLGGGGGDD